MTDKPSKKDVNRFLLALSLSRYSVKLNRLTGDYIHIDLNIPLRYGKHDLINIISFMTPYVRWYYDDFTITDDWILVFKKTKVLYNRIKLNSNGKIMLSKFHLKYMKEYFYDVFFYSYNYDIDLIKRCKRFSSPSIYVLTEFLKQI